LSLVAEDGLLTRISAPAFSVSPPAWEIASISVIGPNVYEADRFATAAFAMGEKGIEFIEKQKKLEGYMIKNNQREL